MWDTAKYIRRAEKRLSEKPHSCNAEFLVYKHGTHYVFPESLLRSIFLIGGGLFLKLAFKAAKEFPKECKQTRVDIDRRVVKIIKEWKK